MTYNPKKHHRRSIRLKGYDYGREGFYFITLCIEKKQHIFGEIKDDVPHLNIFGKIAEEEWLKTSEIRNNIRLHEFVIMPDHFHAIIEITHSKTTENKLLELNAFKSPSQTIGAIIRGFKGATTKRIKEILYQEREESILDSSLSTGELQFTRTTSIKSLDLSKSIWQRNYYEIIIRDELSYLNISNYIKNNPKNRKKDKPHSK